MLFTHSPSSLDMILHVTAVFCLYWGLLVGSLFVVKALCLGVLSESLYVWFWFVVLGWCRLLSLD